MFSLTASEATTRDGVMVVREGWLPRIDLCQPDRDKPANAGAYYPATSSVARGCSVIARCGLASSWGRGKSSDTRPLRWGAVDRELSAVALNQCVDDAETKPGTAVFSGKPAIGLAEWVHHQLGHLGGDADTLIGDAQPVVGAVLGVDRHLDRGSLVAEFYGIRQQFLKHLLHRPPVRPDRTRRSTHRYRYFVLAPGFGLEEFGYRPLGYLSQIHALRRQFEPARLQLRYCQQVDDDAEHLLSGFRAVQGVVDVPAFGNRTERLLSDQIAETDDRI